ncbi:het domain-containing protein [Stagonosporopsis vannaccii]|nr:het domain-containing protein [Stagonosporopsis vannaccii]
MFATTDDESAIPESWDYFLVSSRLAPRSDSEEAIAVIKNWISNCLTDDVGISFCDAPGLRQLPTRVVDVGPDNDSVKLVESRGLQDEYICLSHCWGLEQIITTTKATIDDRKHGISWSLLSKTFQDAISMTRTLGFRYIWIDSLCIVQDDGDDWKRESAQMASVYSNGYLTLAGTRSANGNGGLFFKTHDVPVTGVTPLGEKYRVFFRQHIDHQIESEKQSTVDLHPLLTRAWVYQERMLSTRILHFGRFELFFECKGSITCECGFIEYYDSQLDTEIPLIKIEYADALSQLEVFRSGDMDPDVLYFAARIWRTMITSYTALSLTMPSDRLPALGGLARQMAGPRRSNYLAGLWEDCLIDDLLWLGYPEQIPAPSETRPYPRTAPTWSWASVGTFVDYTDTVLGSSFDEGSEHAREPYEHLATIESCTVTSAAIDEFGAIAEGLLILTGLLVTGWLECEASAPDGDKDRITYRVCTSQRKWAFRADYLLHRDGPDQVALGSEIYCLKMSHVYQHAWQFRFSLVLRQCPGRYGCFERIGIVTSRSSSEAVDAGWEMYETAKMQTVTII